MAARLKQIYHDKARAGAQGKSRAQEHDAGPTHPQDQLVNLGVGAAVADKKVMDAATADMAKITGASPT